MGLYPLLTRSVVIFDTILTPTNEGVSAVRRNEHCGTTLEKDCDYYGMNFGRGATSAEIWVASLTKRLTTPSWRTIRGSSDFVIVGAALIPCLGRHGRATV